MNDKIITSITMIDAAFYPEMKRIAEINDMKDIYNVKRYFSQIQKQILDHTPIHTPTTLLNKIVLFLNKYVKNFGNPSMKFQLFPTKIAKQRMTHNRMFDSLWGNLNIFGSYECSYIREAFEQLAYQFQDLNAHFNDLGFPSILEGLVIMNQILSTLKDQLRLPSVQIYLIKLLQTMFLDDQLNSYDQADFFHQLEKYLDNKYPDGFDRIFTQLRSSFMITQDITYEKPLFYCAEQNYLTNNTNFKLDKLLLNHFTSKPIDIPRDPMFAFHMIVNYIINIYIEVSILTNEQTIEAGLIHMHDSVYNQQYNVEEETYNEEPEIYLSQSQLSIIQSLQEYQINEIDDEQEQQAVIQLIDQEIIQRPENSLDLNQIELILSRKHKKIDPLQYAISLKNQKNDLINKKNSVNSILNSFITNATGRPLNINKFDFQLKQIITKLSEEVNQTTQKTISESELIEFFTGNLHVLSQLKFAQKLQPPKFGAVSPVQAILRILAAMQPKLLQIRPPVLVSEIDFPAELDKICLEIRLKQSSLQLSRTDVSYIIVKLTKEIEREMTKRSELFAKFGVENQNSPSNILQLLIFHSKNSTGPFSKFFTDGFPSLACGPLRRMMEKVVVFLVENFLKEWKVICDENQLFQDGKSLIKFEILKKGEVVQQAQYFAIEDEQKYDYLDIGAYVQVTAPLVDHWIGNEEEQGFLV